RSYRLRCGHDTVFFFSSRRRHTRSKRDWSSDVCSSDLAETEVHPAALRGVDRAVELLDSLGHETTAIPAPFTAAQWRSFMPLWTVGAATIPLAPEQEGELLELTRWLREQGRGYDGIQLAEALAGVQTIARRTGEAFADLDVVLTPALSG